MKWMVQNVEHLKALWRQGLSPTEIAKDFGQGLTREAITAKARSLNLPLRSVDQASAPRAMISEKDKARFKADCDAWTQALAEHERSGEHLLASSLPVDDTSNACSRLSESGCRWPYGIPGRTGFSFCNRTRLDGSPYCFDHNKLSREEPSKTKESNRIITRAALRAAEA